jgi:hypothetical protein
MVLSAKMSGPSGLQPALQLAAVAAHLSPRSRVSWAPFLQFGMTNPMLFSAPFLRPHFNGNHPAHMISAANSASQSVSGISSTNRSIQNQQNEDSNDERGEFFFSFFRRSFSYQMESGHDFNSIASL